MSVDKFGRTSSGQAYSDSGVSIRYVNNNFIRRDGDIDMNNNKITNLLDPVNEQDATTKTYTDSRKPLITIWAQEKGPLNIGQYEWSFGGGDVAAELGYCMPVSGRILRGSISSIAQSGRTSGDANINIIINGRSTSNYLVKPNGVFCNTVLYNPPVRVAQNDRINFRSNLCTPDAINNIVSLLIELDL